MKLYDLIIIGGGPAGLTAGIYGTRAKLDTLLIEKLVVGGKVVTTEKIENYPGFVEPVGGPELIKKMEAQAKSFGLEFTDDSILDISKKDKIFEIKGETAAYNAKSIVIASGTSSASLNIPGEKELRGRGVSYCATCDALFFRDRNVAVVGGGDSALDEGIFLTKFAKKVYIIHRRDQLRATKVLQERAFNNPKIEFVFDSVPLSIDGGDYVEKVVVKNVKNESTKEIFVDGVFLYVGTTPNTDFLNNILKLDEKGYIITNDNMQTDVPGIFAAGDVRRKVLRQISTAVGDGATAAFMAEKYIENEFDN